MELKHVRSVNEEQVIAFSCGDLIFNTETSEKTSETDVVGENTVYYNKSAEVI